MADRIRVSRSWLAGVFFMVSLSGELPMKRSQINRCIAEAATFFAENRFVLPPFADWTPAEWKQCGSEAE
jgi:hypothetical protein